MREEIADRTDIVRVVSDQSVRRVVSELQGGLLDYYYHKALGLQDDKFIQEFARIGHAAHPAYPDVSDEDKRAYITRTLGADVPLA